MNTANPAPISGVIALLAIPLTGYSADQSHRCATVYEDAQRLACYDTAFGKPVRVTEAPAAAPAPARAAVPAPVTAKAPAEPPVAAGKTPKRDAKEGKAAAERVRITSAVAALKRARDGRFEATLQNGEVWAQLEPDSRIEVGVGDVVTIRPAVLGSFLMDTRSGATTRVKRVN